jgi:hypothetical protein
MEEERIEIKRTSSHLRHVPGLKTWMPGKEWLARESA